MRLAICTISLSRFWAARRVRIRSHICSALATDSCKHWLYKEPQTLKTIYHAMMQYGLLLCLSSFKLSLFDHSLKQSHSVLPSSIPNSPSLDPQLALPLPPITPPLPPPSLPPLPPLSPLSLSGQHQWPLSAVLSPCCVPSSSSRSTACVVLPSLSHPLCVQVAPTSEPQTQQ